MKKIYPFALILFLLIAGFGSADYLSALKETKFLSAKKAVHPLHNKGLGDLPVEEKNYPAASGFYGRQEFITYPADIQEGLIGMNEFSPVDDLYDNVFHVELSEMPGDKDVIWLTYELKGVQDHTAVTRSINDQQSTGGNIVRINDQWTKQQERINKQWLYKGNNVIRFSLPDGALYSYRIRSLKLVVEKNAAQAEERAIIVNQPSKDYYNNEVAYLKGFLTGPGAGEAELFIGQMPANLVQHEFEALFNKPENTVGRWNVVLRAVYPDGQEITQSVDFENNRPASYVRPLTEKGLRSEQVFEKNKPGELALHGLQLSVPENAINQDEVLSVTALRDIDLSALNPDMVNVTQSYKGYRMLPHGTRFEQAVNLQIAYDPALIPEGYTDKDIRAFYFDEAARRWLALPKDTLIAEKKVIVSKTTHFTDFIAGIIKVPESPETQGYTPTSIKDIKAADPSAAIVVMAPPTPNSTGASSTNFPLKLPAGRQGMAPELAIQYNSEGGNGWLGLGWDLPLPFVGIETRWGVPRYDADLETETYTLSGAQLFPVAHRQELISRTADKIFHQRIEGAFRKIVRFGNNPKEYWWEVTEKDGTRYAYGGDRNTGVDNNAVLKDQDGNIGHWALREVRDLNDNFIRYDYLIVENTGIPNGSVPGQQLYLDKITYTGHGNSAGKYTVRFIRDRPNDARRLDVIINARLGFKQVTADLLREIRITFEDKPVRNYLLNYQEGAFYKSLLSEIIEFDQDDAEFYRHTFEYHDDVRQGGGYVPYNVIEEPWVVPSDNFGSDAALISATESAGFGGAFALTLGWAIGDYSSKGFTVGGNVSFSDSESNGQIAFVDINGDALPDKVFKEDGILKYRKNLSVTGERMFGEKREITGMVHFSITNNSSGGGGGELHPFPLFVGGSSTETESVTSTYFYDFNGDGLIDIAHRGSVYFNHINSDGDPVFTLESADTPSPIIENGATVNPAIITIDTIEQEVLIDRFPLHDVVRMWQAPCDGTVMISGNVQLIPPPVSSPSNDGVKVAIEFKEITLEAKTIDALDFGMKPMSVSPFSVVKGERIYFRVQSIFNGSNDRVIWDPLIEYTSIFASEIDANGRSNKRYQASEDFLVSAPQYINIFENGDIMVDGTFSKPDTTSDRLTVQVLRNGVAIPGLTWEFAWDEVVLNVSLTEEFSVMVGDELTFRITSNTNVDWSSISWTPRFQYLNSTNASLNGELFYPAVEYTMFNYIVKKTETWAPPPGPGTVQITVQSNIQAPPLPNGLITMSVKGINTWYNDTTFSVGGPPVSLTATVPRGEPVFIEYHTDNRTIADALMTATATVAVSGGASEIVNPGVFGPISIEERLFGHLYRGWGQFTYNGNRERADTTIIEAELMIDLAGLAGLEAVLNTIDTITNPSQLAGLYNPLEAIFVIMMPDPKMGSWRGFDNLTYIKKDTVSSSRMGKDDISVDFSEVFGADKKAPHKIAITDVLSFSGGGGIGPISGSASWSSNVLRNILDVVDINGDRHPDVVGEKDIQFSNARGGLEPDLVGYDLQSHRSEGSSNGFTLGGTSVVSKATNTGSTSGQGSYRTSANLSSMVDKVGNNSNEAAFSAIASIGLAINVSSNTGSDETMHTWLDINGDGLPDKVYKNDSVALNLGYRFAPREPWNYNIVRTGESEDFGLGGGFNWGNMSWAGSAGGSTTENRANHALQDINGDGLLDLLISDNPMRVKINTGNSFGPEIPWPGATVLDEGSSNSVSASGAFTWCVYIWFTPFRLCFNPQASTTNGSSRQNSQIGDVNGDGYPDVLYSNNDGHLTAKRSTIGRTNLLKEVHLPLGASFALDYNITPNTYEMPGSKWVLTSVEIKDGFAGDGADRMKSTFEYEDGLYNRHEREFYGFKTVKAHQLDTENGDSIYRSSISTYDNTSYYRKGLLLSEIVQDSLGNIYTETRNSYELLDINNGAILPAPFNNTDAAAAFPALMSTQKSFFEGQPGSGIQTTINYGYDLLGNIKSYTDSGDGTPDDLVAASITYHDNDSNYIKSIPASIIVNIAGAPLVRRRETSIDPAGNILQIRQYLQDGSSANHNMEYDTYGNLLKITRPLNHRNERLHFEYTYDDEVQTYVTRVRDGYGYKSESVYDFFFGQLLETTDMNNQKMRYTLDNKGRISTITGPYELAAGKPYTIAFEYFPDADVPFAKTKHHDPEHDSDIETYTFMDGLLRPLQVKKTGSLFTEEGVDDDSIMIVSGRVVFDAFGRTTSTRYPVSEPLGTEEQFNAVSDTVAPTQTTYDILDRQLLITLPDGAQTRMDYEIGQDNTGFSHFKTTMTDALGNTRESFSDVRGRKRATKDNGPMGEIWTNFQYNAISELLQVIDDGDNETNYTYDFLGRKRSIDHPDGGFTEFKYDLAGNLTEKISSNLRENIPNGGAIKYTYEKERLIAIDYPKNFQNKVQFHYGDSTATHNRKGRIELQEDASGGQEFFYGPLGEVVKNIRTLLITEANVVTYVSQYEYDTWNRIKRIFYPDGEVLTYHYNHAGKLREMVGEKQTRNYVYIDQLGYDKFEQRVFLKYGNGTVTQYDYEPERRRLSAMQVTNPAGRTFMDNAYGYDPVNNILSLRNTSQAFHLQLGGPAKYNFVYDNLYRLSEAEGEWEAVNRRDSFSLRMEYDNLHNIRRKTQTHWRDTVAQGGTTYDNLYEFQGDKPHAPSKVGGRLYTHDANGNQLGWRGENFFSSRQIIWDEEDRIMGISDNGYLSRYTYDAGGERAIKSHGGVQGIFINSAPAGVVNHRDNYTAYVSPYLVAKEHSFTKHYYVEGQRVASKIGTGKFNNKFWAHGGISAGRRNYTLRIHLLQQAANEFYRARPTAPGPPTLPDFYSQPEITGNAFPQFALDSAYTMPPRGWPQPPLTAVPGTAPGAPTLPTNSAVTNDDVKAGYGFYGDGNFNHEGNQFFYHPDHLGSSSYITDINGQIRQHIEYLPFGETFVDEHTNSDVQPYLYNAKELDAETGLYYYGARYYDPMVSLWASVDPMAEKFPGWSPYNYVLQNPMVMVDPDGRDPKLGSVAPQNAPSSEFKKGLQESMPDLNVAMGEFSLGLEVYKNDFKKTVSDMLVSRKALPLSEKIGSFGDFSKRYKTVINNAQKVAKLSNWTSGPLGVLSVIADGYLNAEALENDWTAQVQFGANTMVTYLGVRGGPKGIAFALGYSVGQKLDSKFNWSDKLGNFLNDWDPLFLNKGQESLNNKLSPLPGPFEGGRTKYSGNSQY